jgi:pyruvate,water dikinase
MRKTAEIAVKERRLRLNAADGLREEAVPAELRQAACLDDPTLRRLADYGLKLEAHYGGALDIEWAIDQQGRLYILQARPLKRSQRFGADQAAPGEVPNTISNHPVLIHGGQTACDGTAAGYAYVIESDHTLHHIPEGALVVARQTSPRYVPLMGRIRAFITDIGSVTGHMASVAREFQIPTLVGTGNATAVIAHGEEITLDAARRTVYRGRLESLLTEKKPVNPMKDSPTYNTVKAVLKRIAPLRPGAKPCTTSSAMPTRCPCGKCSASATTTPRKREWPFLCACTCRCGFTSWI